MEDHDIKEAPSRLPREIVDARNHRLLRAMDLSMKTKYLPEDLQGKRASMEDFFDVKMSKKNGKTVCLFKIFDGPATVGRIRAGAFKIGDIAGTIDNIVQCKLYRPGSVGFVSKSVLQLEEMCFLDQLSQIMC